MRWCSSASTIARTIGSCRSASAWLVTCNGQSPVRVGEAGGEPGDHLDGRDAVAAADVGRRPLLWPRQLPAGGPAAVQLLGQAVLANLTAAVEQGGVRLLEDQARHRAKELDRPPEQLDPLCPRPGPL